MKHATVLVGGARTVAVITDEIAVPIRGCGELTADNLGQVLATQDPDHANGRPLSQVTFRPPLPQPRKVIFVGLNYRARVHESPHDPVLFTKFANTLTGAYDPVVCVRESDAVDYEGELVVIIGRHARRVTEADALGYVSGYSVANDISMRDYQNFTHQWLPGKAWDASTSVGPYLVTTDQVPDPSQLTLRTVVNGDVLQEATTDRMIFTVPRLVSTISEFVTLEPGDMILTGTPSGIGFRRTPPLLLQPGDTVAVEVSDMGRTENRMIADTAVA